MANIGNLFREVLPQSPVDVNPLPQFQTPNTPEFSAKGATIVLQSLLQQLGSLPSSALEGVKPQPGADVFLFDQDSGITPQQLDQRKLFQVLNGLQI